MDLRTFTLPGGVKCGHCGAVLLRVNHTRTSDGLVMRERICETCGKLNTTSERVIDTRNRKRYLSEPAE